MTIEAPAVPREYSQACKVTADGEVIVQAILWPESPQPSTATATFSPVAAIGVHQADRHRLSPTSRSNEKARLRGLCLFAGRGFEFVDPSLSFIFR